MIWLDDNLRPSSLNYSGYSLVSVPVLDSLIVAYLPRGTEVVLAPGLSSHWRDFTLADVMKLVGDAVTDDQPELIEAIVLNTNKCTRGKRRKVKAEKETKDEPAILPLSGNPAIFACIPWFAFHYSGILEFLHTAMKHGSPACFCQLLELMNWERCASQDAISSRNIIPGRSITSARNIITAIEVGLGKVPPPVGRRKENWGLGLYLDDAGSLLPVDERFDEEILSGDSSLVATISYDNREIALKLLQEAIEAKVDFCSNLCHAIVKTGQPYLDRAIEYFQDPAAPLSGNLKLKQLMRTASFLEDTATASKIIHYLSEKGVPVGVDLIGVLYSQRNIEILEMTCGRVPLEDLIAFFEGFPNIPSHILSRKNMEKAVSFIIEYLEGKNTLITFDQRRVFLVRPFSQKVKARIQRIILRIKKEKEKYTSKGKAKHKETEASQVFQYSDCLKRLENLLV